MQDPLWVSRVLMGRTGEPSRQPGQRGGTCKGAEMERYVRIRLLNWILAVEVVCQNGKQVGHVQ